MQKQIGLKSLEVFFSIIHQNLQSIGNSVDRIEDLLSENIDCNALCVTEHWKTATQLQNYGIKRFRLITSFSREQENSGGGSAIYVSDQIRTKVRHDINSLSSETNFECSSCECKTKNITVIILSIYRPPKGDFAVFLTAIEEALTLCFESKNLVIIAGDFNIDFLTPSNKLSEFIELLKSFNMTYTIKEPTRITANSKTCLDNILVDVDLSCVSQVLHAHIWDHTAQKLRMSVQTFYHC